MYTLIPGQKKKTTDIRVDSKFSLEKYVNEFKREAILLPKYNVFNKKKETHENNSGLLSTYYSDFLVWQVNYEPLSYESVLKLYLNFVDYYYDYYLKFPPLTYAVAKAIDLTFNLKILKRDSIFLNEISKKYLTIYILKNLYDSLELDINTRNKFSKKKCLTSLIENIEILWESDHFRIKNNLDGKLEQNLMKEKFLKKLTKCILILEHILISLNVCKACIDYSENSNNLAINTKNDLFTRDKNSNNIEKLKELTQSSNLEDNSQIENIITISLSETTQEKKYIKTGLRYLLFSLSIEFVPNIKLALHKKRGFLIENKIIFPKSDYVYFPFVYNQANPLEFSKFKYNSNLLNYLISEKVIYCGVLFSLLVDFFKVKYNKDTQDSQRTRTFSLVDFLSKEFYQNNQLEVYFPYKIDFRGRIYMQGALSITDTKLFRYIIKPNTANKITKINKYYQKIKSYLYILNTTKIDQKLYSEKELVFILIAFINLGKIVKSRLLIGSPSISIEVFLKTGIEIYYKDTEEVIRKYELRSVEDIGYIITSRCKLYSFLTKEISDFTIIVDSTASGIFHLSLWLKLKKQYLIYINMVDDSNWWDTYQFIYNLVLIEIEKSGQPVSVKEDLKKNLYPLFTRKKIKIIFMTIPYKATEGTLYKYFVNGLTEKEMLGMRPLFSIFLYYTKSVFSNLFEHDINNMQNLPYFQNNRTFSFMNNIYDFNYYQTTYKDIKYSVGGENFYSSYIEIITERDKTGNIAPILDKRKTEIAFVANVIHATDAMFLNITYKYCHKTGIKINTVHDEFIVPISNYFEFLEYANIAYRELYFEINKCSIDVDNFFIFI